MSTNKSSIDLVLIYSLIVLLLSVLCHAFDVRQREDINDRFNDVIYNEVESNGAADTGGGHTATEDDHKRSHLESVAKHMTQWLRSDFSEELGVTHMQQIYDTLNTVKHNINFETLIEDITQKVWPFIWFDVNPDLLLSYNSCEDFCRLKFKT